jgi:hypothetical protein
MQDATQLIKNSGLRRVAGAITDVAALGERAILGHGRDDNLKCTCGKPRAERRQKKPRKRKNNKKIK